MASASTPWTGDLQKGAGRLVLVPSELGEYEVTLPTRLQTEQGRTNPTERMAAEHASCLAMSFSGVLAKEGLKAERTCPVTKALTGTEISMDAALV